MRFLPMQFNSSGRIFVEGFLNAKRERRGTASVQRQLSADVYTVCFPMSPRGGDIVLCTYKTAPSNIVDFLYHYAVFDFSFTSCYCFIAIFIQNRHFDQCFIS